jgi:hypothetical protein
MLYDLSTNQPIAIPDWAEEEMKQDFPDFFKGKPVKISANPESMISSMKVPSHDYNQEPKLFIEPPADYLIKPKGIMFDKEDGYQMHIQYSDAAVNIASQEVRKIYIRHNMTVQPYEKEFLFYLQYLCPIIKDNKSYRKSSRPIFKFDKPEVEAKNKIDAARAARDLENLIYFDAPYTVIMKAISGLALTPKDSEEENRVMLHDAIKNGSDTFRKNAFEILDAQPKKQEVNVDETIHEMVNRLSSEGFIKNEDGIWYLRDRRGDGTKWLKNPFFESTGEKDAFALIDHLKVNDELLEKLRKLK